MSRILVIGENTEDLLRALAGYNPGADPGRFRIPGQLTITGDTYHFHTPHGWGQTRGYTWDRIEITPNARHHPQFEEFTAYAQTALRRIPVGLRRVNAKLDQRATAAIELAEAYRAITQTDNEDGPRTALVDRLVDAAQEWEKIR